MVSIRYKGIYWDSISIEKIQFNDVFYSSFYFTLPNLSRDFIYEVVVAFLNVLVFFIKYFNLQNNCPNAWL